MTVISPTRWHDWLRCQRMNAAMNQIGVSRSTPEDLWSDWFARRHGYRA